jgi:hypothetical protein
LHGLALNVASDALQVFQSLLSSDPIPDRFCLSIPNIYYFYNLIDIMIAAPANDISYLTYLLQTRSCSAFSKFYDTYSAAIFGVICKTVKNKMVAEELLQEAFIKAWRNIDNYDASKATLFTWLLRIASSTCANYMQTANTQNN